MADVPGATIKLYRVVYDYTRQDQKYSILLVSFDAQVAVDGTGYTVPNPSWVSFHRRRIEWDDDDYARTPSEAIEKAKARAGRAAAQLNADIITMERLRGTEAEHVG
jgi:hypothetical protein